MTKKTTGTKTRKERTSLLARIHIAKKELGLDDDLYRDGLRDLFGKESAGDLTLPELRNLCAEYVRRGWKPKNSKTRKTPSVERTPLCKKAWAICASLGLPWGYADGVAKQMFRIERLVWCSPEQIHAVVAALMRLQRKQGKTE